MRFLITFIFAAALSTRLALAAGPEATEPDSWPDLSHAFFKDRVPVEDPDIVTLDAPTRAEDAALVPMTLAVHVPEGDPRKVVAMSLVIDENPVPLAGTFKLGDGADVARISTRVRVNSYTNVHLVAELSDGSLHMATRYVKAAGGCSAPAAKSPDEANALLGKMKFRLFPAYADGRREALVMLHHPNNSGLQMDQVTRLYTPARYIDHFAVYQGDALIFSVESGISISEDPNFRFVYRPDGAKTLRIEASDIDGAKFSAAWPVEYDGG